MHKSHNAPLLLAIHINGIPISLHLDRHADVTVVTEKHYGNLRVNCSLQQTSVAIRSYSGEGKGSVLETFTAALVRGEKVIAEPVCVVKGQGDTALLSRGSRGVPSGSNYEHTTNSHGGHTAGDH